MFLTRKNYECSTDTHQMEKLSVVPENVAKQFIIQVDADGVLNRRANRRGIKQNASVLALRFLRYV